MDVYIIQITPAPANLFAITYDDNGNKIRVPIACMALNNLGVVQYMYSDSSGNFWRAKEVSRDPD